MVSVFNILLLDLLEIEKLCRNEYLVFSSYFVVVVEVMYVFVLGNNEI
jgi:hypothetical protein